LGSDVSENPWLLFQNPNYLNLKDNGERTFFDGDDPFNPGSGCSLDGLAFSCSQLEREIQAGAVQSYQPDVWRKDRNGLPSHLYDDVIDHGLGIYMTYLYSRTNGDFRGSNSVIDVSQDSPSETTKIPLINLKKLLKDTLAYGDCADFMARLIGKAGELSKGKNDPISTDMMQIYSLLNRQSRGGIELNHDGPYYNYWSKGYQELPPVAGGGGLADGTWQQQNRKVFINQIELPSRTSALNVARAPYEYAHRILHEFTHVAGANDFYSHDIMDASARALGSRDADMAIREHCIPRQMW